MGKNWWKIDGKFSDYIRKLENVPPSLVPDTRVSMALSFSERRASMWMQINYGCQGTPTPFNCIQCRIHPRGKWNAHIIVHRRVLCAHRFCLRDTIMMEFPFMTVLGSRPAASLSRHSVPSPLSKKLLLHEDTLRAPLSIAHQILRIAGFILLSPTRNTVIEFILSHGTRLRAN